MSETRGHQGAGAADCALRGPPPARARERQGEKEGARGTREGGPGHEGGREAASEPGAKFLSNGTAGGATRGRAGTEPPSPCSHTALAWGIQGQRPLGGN